ncbi:sulfurtransferase [Streptomyces sp. NP160]|uniref:rhodanese-like domain-containing protein n=1 Tax=Streptomyces sp. NP160 TaxID=2586637 RepID=UPI0011193DCF|nr:rhodanese-like domain-containing protein [Streptomyces sp. NP160]TNM70247.1 sulfurtransferase [Streptomyces sp. NP160]
MTSQHGATSAADFFAARLAHQTDPADLARARATGAAPLVVDVRSAAGWAQGRIPGAVHVPLAELTDRIGEHAPDLDAEVVVYCWGPGCNGSTRAGLALALAGYGRVKELVGGYEYWVREGFAVVSDAGRSRRAPDPLAAPAG